MQTDIAVDPAGNVWAMNNWQDVDVCITKPPEPLSTRTSLSLSLNLARLIHIRCRYIACPNKLDQHE